MPAQSKRRLYIKDKVQLIILIILIINTVLIAFGYLLAADRFSGEDSILVYKQELARDLSDYNHRLATDLGVYDLASVRNALAAYNYAVDFAVGSDELIQVILNQGRQAQEIIFEEADARLKEKVLIAVNNDSRVKEAVDKTHLFVRITDGQISIYPDQYLESNTVQRIENIFSMDLNHDNQNIDIEVADGVAELIMPKTVEEQMRFLNEDLNTMRLVLHELRVKSGLAEMVGPGITLSVFDAEEPQGSVSLAHDADIRDIVNELSSAGARGISVGGQRLTATSAIRCSGPLIMVNYRQILTNPVIIQAIGDPDLLINGLNIILYELETRRGLVFEIDHSGFIKLPAYVGID
ncbi:MAG: DUF881 domain-containing protein [Clostridia bacterium]|nr:DUF881 domain-containing protein [Clostridia bacterium]